MHSDNIPDRVDTDNSVIRRERRAIIDGRPLAVEEVDTQVITAGYRIAASGTAPFAIEAAIERVGCGLGVGYTNVNNAHFRYDTVREIAGMVRSTDGEYNGRIYRLGIAKNILAIATFHPYRCRC